ncbi:hypothetical protein DSL72_000614 [Monilinia vaccinii-corymbosi]|uniref:Xylanolytic transcriptional activator regulatory domain-containing protein n=1 Tax=Monilinia vaccinii-corymbosi TaxID=61207 RepID=A0A8A3NZU4_9HELO|nr:hypothetical protein DSL72_000614 [Monilinia vaccinii-corymbosi]
MDCTVTTKERKKREKKKGNHITLLEDRLKRMEHVMTNSGISMDASGLERQPSQEINYQAGMFEKFSSLNISGTGSEEFVGAASGFSIFSPQGLQLISKMTGNDGFAKFMAERNHIQMNQYSVGSSLWYSMPDEKHKSLPPKEVADKIMEFIFDRLIPSFPLFDRKTFMERYSRQYPVKCSEDPAWYACLNVCFAIASIIRKEDLPGNSPPREKSPSLKGPETLSWWKWLRNAASTFVDLQFGPPSFLAVQAMTGLAFILDTLSDSFPCSVVSAATIRLAQAIGLHRNISYSGLSEAEVEQRRNVFWIAVMIERGAVIRQGRPSVIHDEDIGVDLPPENQYPSNVDGRFITFRHNATLSLLHGRIYNRLYSAKSFTKSKSERLRIVGMLDDELQQWCETLPIEVRPGHPLKCDERHLVTVVCTQWVYYQCLSTIHRVSLYYGPGCLDPDGDKSQGDFDPTLNPRVYASAAICVNAARRTIHLLEECTKLSSPMSIHNALSSCVTLFANILQHPLDPQVQSDLRLMNDVISFISSFEDQCSGTGHPALPIFQEITRVAAEHVNKAQFKAPKYSKRSRAKYCNVDNTNTESDESDYEDYKTEEQAGSMTGSEYLGSPTSPVNSARTHVPPFSPPTPFEYNPSAYNTENVPTSMQQAYNIQPTAQDAHQSPPYYDINPPMQHHTNVPGLNQYPQINGSSYHHQPPHPPLHASHLESEPQPFSSHPFTHTPNPATNFYHSSPEQQQAQNINPLRTNPFSNPMRNPNTNLRTPISQAEEPLAPQDGSWFFPMISPWSFIEGSDMNSNGIDGGIGGASTTWAHNGSNVQGGTLGGWGVQG